MPKNILICHAETPCPAIHEFSVNVELDPKGNLLLFYQLSGDLTRIAIPSAQTPAAVDGLWEHTCFEAFLALGYEKNYHEFNFSPSGQYAAYAFNDYRIRKDWIPANKIGINVSKSDEKFELNTIITGANMPAINTGKTLAIGLSAVIELHDGSQSYWALYHPSKSPDFHHRDGLILAIDQNEIIQ